MFIYIYIHILPELFTRDCLKPFWGDLSPTTQVSGHGNVRNHGGVNGVGQTHKTMPKCVKSHEQFLVSDFSIFSGWWFGTFFIFPLILGMSSSQLIFIFFRGVAQPPTSFAWAYYSGIFRTTQLGSG